MKSAKWLKFQVKMRFGDPPKSADLGLFVELFVAQIGPNLWA